MTVRSSATGAVRPPVPTAVSTAYLDDPGSIVEHTAGSGLRITAVRRPSVPVVELRLAVPFGSGDSAHAATAEVLAAVLLGSTARGTRAELEAALGLLGGSLKTAVTPERLTVQGAIAADGLAPALELLAAVLADPHRPEDEVLTHRTLLGHRLRAYRAQPAVLAREAMLEHCFPGHPLAREVPAPDAVAAVGDAHVEALHTRALVPSGSRLLLVGDLDPAAAVAAAEQAMLAWNGPGTAAPMPELPHPAAGVAVVSRPGSRQVQVCLLAPAPGADDPEHPAMRLANLVLGASFSSRLTERLRERDGLTYIVRSRVADHPGRGLLAVDFDTRPNQLGAALAAVRQEFDAFANDAPPSEEEIAAARSYTVGSMVILSATQNGTANLLNALPPATGLGDWLPEQLQRIARTTDDQVRAAARELAAANFSGIVLTAPSRVEEAAREVRAAGFLPSA
ncbi:insulinase family protein [Streptacidiphilus sp. PB12-B1b]|uniref:M16 family metallopeptidase n=1 Tax=Streptacidiphilus sp. PB12-B1b TaxID=2705012 RepID=UPI0015F8F78E|nr:insulinase family protein [Streptacidiphilus sp. PB12-B1b]QMU78102.1 insulinase family protein [Streptacidiphilus sp. PB12-B1b]